VSNIRFCLNGTHVISAGGNDRTIIQWKVIGGKGSLVSPPDTPQLPPPSLRLKKTVSTELKRTQSPEPDVSDKLLFDLRQQELLSEEQVKNISEILNDKRKEKIQGILNKFKKEPKKAAEFAKELESIL